MNLHEAVTPRSVPRSYGPIVTQRNSAKVGSPRDDLKIVVAQTSPHRVDAMKSVALKSAGRDHFVITQMLRKSPGHGITESQARADAFVACVHLDDFSAYELWCEDRHHSSRPLKAGMIHINDMRHKWRADIRGAFNVVNFYIPQGALDEIADEHGAAHIEDVTCPIERGHTDAILSNLALALLPALAQPRQTNNLFAEHAARTVAVHVAQTYGSSAFQLQGSRGGLAPWQERRAKDLLSGDLSGNISVRELASACNLSPSHFSQAFRQTVGAPPHQWLLIQRIERAKQLLLNTKEALCQIALASGFADQSHFTRVFSRQIGASPAVWRRAQQK